ncbi:MAG: hypothetical protein JRF33_08005 [Deltaproteobacteria bacterium]|nr:hypothetical protein [Deltaproteobacteria bacterium]
METVTTILFIVLGGGLAIFIWVIGYQQEKKAAERRRVLVQALAEQVGGRVLPATFTRSAELHFSHKGKDCRLVFDATGGNHPTHYTCFIMDLGSKPPF